MRSKLAGPRMLGLLIGIVGLTALLVAGCSSDPTATPRPTNTPVPTATAEMMEPTAEMMEPTAAAGPKEAIKLYSTNWTSIELNTRIPAYILQNGYQYPIEYVIGTTGTMKVAFPIGEMHVNMEIWRQNIYDWYEEHIDAGNIVDLAGTGDSLPNGSKGQILENSAQGFYVPQYVVDENPGLVSVSDLPDYVELFPDPEDPSKGLVYNGIIGWQAQKINRAKWYAYGLFDTYNMAEPGSAGALDASIQGAYDATEPVLAYYWEPTTIVNELNLVRLEEPEWTQECQDAINAGVESTPYESTIGCAYQIWDVHTGVHSSLAERAPDATEFLANVFIGALELGALEAWKNENDAEWRDTAVYYLENNRDLWTSWITDDNADEIIARVDEALAAES